MMTIDHLPHRRQCLLAVLLLAAAPRTFAAPKKKRRREPRALITGTVFQSNGRLLPGAKVVIANESKPKKKAEGWTDRRGEFAIRVPAGEARYVVTATAKGFESQQKTVEVYADEKVTANLLLQPK